MPACRCWEQEVLWGWGSHSPKTTRACGISSDSQHDESGHPTVYKKKKAESGEEFKKEL